MLITVATDGAATSGAAVGWAAREAAQRGAALRVVHVFEADRVFAEGDAAREFAEGVVADACARAREEAPDLAVEGMALIGHPAARLLDLSGGPEMLVLGNRGRGGFAGLLLGSVSYRVATRARCPVVVVRGRTGTGSGPVVAGVDDSPAAEQVLAGAFAAADQGGCPLTVVRAYLPEAPVWLSDRMPAGLDTKEQEVAEQAHLEERLRPWRDKHPGVPVEVRLTHDGAAGALVAASRDARLVVVGSRGHNAIGAALLGSTVLQLLHHAECPVAVM